MEAVKVVKRILVAGGLALLATAGVLVYFLRTPPFSSDDNKGTSSAIGVKPVAKSEQKPLLEKKDLSGKQSSDQTPRPDGLKKKTKTVLVPVDALPKDVQPLIVHARNPESNLQARRYYYSRLIRLMRKKADRSHDLNLMCEALDYLEANSTREDAAAFLVSHLNSSERGGGLLLLQLADLALERYGDDNEMLACGHLFTSSYFLKTKQYTAAIDEAKKAIAAAPTSNWAFRARSNANVAYTENRDYKGAAEFFEEQIAARTTKDDGEALSLYFQLAVKYELQGNAGYPKAIEAYDYILAHAPEDSPLRKTTKAMKGALLKEIAGELE